MQETACIDINKWKVFYKKNMESLLTLGILLLASTFKSLRSPDTDEEDKTHLLYYTKEGNKETNHNNTKPRKNKA
jgi:hypothetical protein